VQDQEILPNKVGGPGGQGCKETFADSVLPLFREFRECTVDAEVEWRLLKAAVATSAARVCGRKRLCVANNGKKVTP